MSTLFFPLALGSLVAPQYILFRTHRLSQLPDALRDLHERMTDLEGLRREHYRARTAVEAVHQGLVETAEQLAAARHEFTTRSMAFQKLEQDLMRERQEKGDRAREVERWRRAAMDYLDALQHALSHAELDPARRTAVEKAADDFLRLVRPLGLERILPAANDPFDDSRHEIEAEADAEGIDQGSVVDCTDWGYSLTTQVVRRARVTVARAHANTEAGPRGPERGDTP